MSLKFLGLEMGLVVVPCLKHESAITDRLCCHVQLMLQSSVADAGVKVFTKAVLKLFKLLVSAAVTPNLNQTSDDYNPYDVKSEKASNQPEVEGE